eukprot:205065_1
MVFIIRVRHPSGMKRIEFPSSNSTWSDLQRKIKELYGIPPESQLISRTPLISPQFIDASPSNTFSSLKLRHGAMLELVPDENGKDATMAVSPKTSKEAHKITSRCRHGPMGRCFHCSSVAPGTEIKGKCVHGTGVRCQNCSDYVKSAESKPADWLCRHAETAFCPNCLPKAKHDESTRLPRRGEECSCSPGQKCLLCLNRGPAIKVDLKPYHQYLDDLKKTCQHEQSKTCPFCAPQKLVSYKGDPNCTGTHQRWPYGICSRCMPPNAVLRQQKYRHCDGLSFQDNTAAEKFIQIWQTNPGLQRACLMFGTFVDEPTATQNVGAIRCLVQGLYVMPHTPQPLGVELKDDSQQARVLEIAAACGLVPVGWVVTTLPRGGDKYHGDMLMSGAEIRQAGRFQWQFRDEWEHSKFLTMVIQYNKQGQIEPKVYQVSDQCVAMERDNLLADAKDPGYLSSRKAKSHECVPSIVSNNRVLPQGDGFLPDELLVKVISMKPFSPSHIFKYVSFPLVDATENDLRAHLRRTADEPYHSRFSDFNLLLWLPRVVGLQTTLELAKCVSQSKDVPSKTRIELDSRLATYM